MKDPLFDDFGLTSLETTSYTRLICSDNINSTVGIIAYRQFRMLFDPIQALDLHFIKRLGAAVGMSYTSPIEKSKWSAYMCNTTALRRFGGAVLEPDSIASATAWIHCDSSSEDGMTASKIRDFLT